jgi:hypothetical protein
VVVRDHTLFGKKWVLLPEDWTETKYQACSWLSVQSPVPVLLVTCDDC